MVVCVLCCVYCSRGCISSRARKPSSASAAYVISLCDLEARRAARAQRWFALRALCALVAAVTLGAARTVRALLAAVGSGAVRESMAKNFSSGAVRGGAHSRYTQSVLIRNSAKSH